MDASMKLRDLLGRITTTDLWIELAKRFDVKFGKIQMAIHDGRPSKYATIDMKICTEEDSVKSPHKTED